MDTVFGLLETDQPAMFWVMQQRQESQDAQGAIRDDPRAEGRAIQVRPFLSGYPCRPHDGAVTLGAAGRGVLLPRWHAMLQGGLALKPPFSAEGSASFRRYREADVYALNFAAFLYGKDATLSCAYSPSQTFFRAGGKSGVLSSVRAKAVWSGWRFAQPWLSYARAEEAFEAGLSGAGSFKAAHYGAGASWRFWPAWLIETYYLLEDRNQSGRRVERFGLGASCLWGG